MVLQYWSNTPDFDAYFGDVDSEEINLHTIFSSSPRSIPGYIFPVKALQASQSGLLALDASFTQSQILVPDSNMQTQHCNTTTCSPTSLSKPYPQQQSRRNRDPSLSPLGQNKLSRHSSQSSSHSIILTGQRDWQQSHNDLQHRLGPNTSHAPYLNYDCNTLPVSESSAVLQRGNAKIRGGTGTTPNFSDDSSRRGSVASTIQSSSQPATPTPPPSPPGSPRNNVGHRRRNAGERLFQPDGNHDQDCDGSYIVSPSISTVPKFDRTMTDMVGDTLYNANLYTPVQPPPRPRQTAASTFFSGVMQAANNHHLMATSSAPPSTAQRGQSPFQTGSQLAPNPSHAFPLQQFTMNIPSPQASSNTPNNRAGFTKAPEIEEGMPMFPGYTTKAATPETISPQDLPLEFNDNGSNNFSLFPEPEGILGFNINPMDKAVSQNNNYNSLSLDDGLILPVSQLSNPSSFQVGQEYGFQLPMHRKQPSLPSACSFSLSHIESTGSPSSTASSPQRPEHVGADGGTYTCTYHGCTQRFESPQELQKHKREGHRQAHGLNGLRRPEASPTAGNFNTQAGPHKCTRDNPSTGKPCNVVFSRPYDLTRHEDTIHNGRKQKVRCNVCTEEKTFSRADALTRHYRVCHPDLEVPGKQRRRGGSPS